MLSMHTTYSSSLGSFPDVFSSLRNRSEWHNVGAIILFLAELWAGAVEDFVHTVLTGPGEGHHVTDGNIERLVRSGRRFPLNGMICACAGKG